MPSGCRRRRIARQKCCAGSGKLRESTVWAHSASVVPGQARTERKPNAPKLLTPEASLNLRNISDVQFSSDGNRLAFVVTEPAKGERRARHIWIYEKQSALVRQFTFSVKSEFLPRWSPDGKQLAFLS